MDAPVPTRRRRKWLIRLTVLAGFFAVGVWFLPALVANTGLRNELARRALADVKGTSTVGGASLGWFSSIELHDVQIDDAEGRTVVTVEKIVVGKNLIDLLLNQNEIGTVKVEAPVVRLECEPGKSNLEAVFAHYLESDNSQPQVERRAINLTVERGKVILKDRGKETEFVLEPVWATVTIPRNREEPITANASITSGGTMAVEASIGSTKSGKLTAREFNLANIGPLLHRFQADTSAKGVLTADLSFDGLIGPDGQPAGSASGNIAVTELLIHAPGVESLRIENGTLPIQAKLAHGELSLDSVKFTSEIGTVSASGSFPLEAPLEDLIGRPGLSLDANVDLAKLAMAAPKLLRLREGTTIREGKITVKLASTAGNDGTLWSGSVSTTSLKGTREGQAIAWDQPLNTEFSGRLRKDGLPVFDKFQCQSDFIGLAARGSPEQFVAAANLDLDRLSARLGEFVDLAGIRFGGTAAVTVKSVPRSDRGFDLTLSANLERFQVQDGSGRSLQEPSLIVTAKFGGEIDPAKNVLLESGEANVTAGNDALAVRILERIPNLKSLTSGRASARLQGDLTRWRNRIGSFVDIPKSWNMSGSGTLAGVVLLSPTGAEFDLLTADLQTVHFRGAGLTIDEKAIAAQGHGTWDKKTGSFTFSPLKITCETLALSNGRFTVDSTREGTVGTLTGQAVADVFRVQKAVGLQPDPNGSDAVHGHGTGPIKVEFTQTEVSFEGQMNVERFAFGPANKPHWSEPVVKVNTSGSYGFSSDTVKFRKLNLERDGLTADAAGTIAKASTIQELDFAGTLNYDLAKLQPQLRNYLGHGATATGRESKQFKVGGSLGNSLVTLNGNAGFGWQAITAYGFNVGTGDIALSLDKGVLKGTPINATFGDGRVRAEPRIDLNAANYPLTVVPGKIVERAKVTPAVCANALGYALPAIANAGRADGLVSFDLAENFIPLADPTKANLKGVLTIHTATVSAGPLIAEITSLLGGSEPTLNLTTEQRVPVRVENGRVFHENFTLDFGKYSIKSGGSVGFDGTLALVLDLPIPPRALDKALQTNPAIRDALGKQRVHVPVGGTLAKPKLDPRAFDAGIAELARNAAKDAVKSKTDDLIKKGEQKLIEELKKIGPFKK